MFLHVVGHNQRFRVIHNTFRQSTETISRYFQQVLYELGSSEVNYQVSINEHTNQDQEHLQVVPLFQDCIGATDGTHVTAKVPRSMSAAFRRRKHYTSQNMLADVDFDMRFTYVLAGWEGSAHDASILADSLSRPDGLQIPNEK
ncbi:protein ALP1-like [Lolium perenne]|uniref:protein ALP1-like n=1 Tax=Lolium perenne TaxID=4522 RepID=UPI003A9977CC